MGDPSSSWDMWGDAIEDRRLLFTLFPGDGPEVGLLRMRFGLRLTPM